MRIDGNNRPYSSLDTFSVVEATPTAFIGGTANARGDSAGTGNPLTLFTVTGDVIVRVYGYCTVNLASAGGGTLEVGVTGNTAALIPQSTGTDIDAGDVWIDATPAEVGAVAVSNIPAATLIANGLDIIETTGTADITAGNIRYVCLWQPVTYGSSVVAA